MFEVIQWLILYILTALFYFTQACSYYDEYEKQKKAALKALIWPWFLIYAFIRIWIKDK